MEKYCIIIPFYNHAIFLPKLIADLSLLETPVVIIDDGSEQNQLEQLHNLTKNHPFIELIHHQENKGKGAAIKTGMYWAQKKRFNYAVQVDADGQHYLADVPQFIKLSKENPNALICGFPTYDKTVPKSRLYARYLTHVWVWINTLSFTIKDSMCGFRVYPVLKTIQAIEKYNIPNKMAFDTDIIVRLYWDKTPILNQETRVIYPKNGISHFNVISDNILISKMHAKLFLFMLANIYKKIFKGFIK